jgi:hypothetical protein
VPYDGTDKNLPSPEAPPRGETDRTRVGALRSIFAFQKREIVKDLLESGDLTLVNGNWTEIFQSRLPELTSSQVGEIHGETVEMLKKEFLLSQEQTETPEQLATRFRRVFNARRRDVPQIIEEIF